MVSKFGHAMFVTSSTRTKQTSKFILSQLILRVTPTVVKFVIPHTALEVA